MKYIGLLILPLVLIIGSWTTNATQTSPKTSGKSDDKAFAVLELFTSQGCSSCPPADEQLSHFAQRSQTGEAIFALSYHVDYWNYLGWKDPFSDPRFSDRQRQYATKLNSRVYTPQLVVNGQAEMIGSRKGETAAAVKKALSRSVNHSLTFEYEVSENTINVTYQLLGKRLSPSTLVAVIVQNNASSAVNRGENHGRQLKHVNVVRVFEQQKLADNNGQLFLNLPSEDQAYSLILFAQEDQSGNILAAAKAAL